MNASISAYRFLLSGGASLAGFLAAIGLLLACGTKMIDYVPTPSLAVSDAKKTIYRTLEEQPFGFAPINIVVSDEKLSFTQVRDRILPGASNALPVTFYFRSLGDMDLAPKRKGNQVRVFDESGVFRFRVIIPSEERARRFMDAMVVMSQSVDSPHE